MSGQRYDAVTSGDRVRRESGREAAGHRDAARDAGGTGEEQRRTGAVMEPWRESPHCTEHERRERWPVG